MGETKYTPGPWSVPHFADDSVQCNCAYVLSEGYMGAVADVRIGNGKPIDDGGNDCPPLEEAKANAHLIAAAPCMYEALTALYTEVVSGRSDTDLIVAFGDSELLHAIAAARAALLKAQGKQTGVSASAEAPR